MVVVVGRPDDRLLQHLNIFTIETHPGLIFQLRQRLQQKLQIRAQTEVGEPIVGQDDRQGGLLITIKDGPSPSDVRYSLRLVGLLKGWRSARISSTDRIIIRALCR